ncbi:T9SS type A sorting domain-containing protein [Polaribacter porphyrae]|uniref:Secretion system C-terminal sorting domain-containing protein n=1 Tax=Polaribacter porphyrae TaxID=1137780 RepID=A0A2S7WR90_9FLAO|nr:T9SS type A sorting domain-containing protein [Polaribacter porphyrae]PQJ80099.1 hypothetical protein BTO18_13355 [Polaribacter porphyrae]
MKNKIIFLLFILSYTVYSQNCNIGNETATGQFTTASISSNVLVGIKVNLTEEGTLRSLNVIGNIAGSGIKMALYDDNSGVPNDLITSTSANTLKNGINSFVVTPKLLPAGDYWIMAIYETKGNNTKVNFSASGNTAYFKNIDYNDDLPNNASDFSSFTGQDYLYYLGVDCGNTLSNQNFKFKKVVLYPNPSNEYIQVLNLDKKANFSIINLKGQEILKGNIKDEKISIKNLKPGLYFIKIDNKKNLKFIKT